MQCNTGHHAREVVACNVLHNATQQPHLLLLLYCAALIALPCLSAWALVGYTFPRFPYLYPPFTFRVGITRTS